MTKKKKSKRDEPVCSVEYKELYCLRDIIPGAENANIIISKFEEKIAGYLNSNMGGYKDVSGFGVANAFGLRLSKIEFESLDGLVDGKIYRDRLWGEEFVGVKVNFISNKEKDDEKYMGLARIVNELPYLKYEQPSLDPKQKLSENRIIVTWFPSVLAGPGAYIILTGLGYTEQTPWLTLLGCIGSGLSIFFLSHLLAKKLFPEPQAKIKEYGVSESSGSGIPPAATL